MRPCLRKKQEMNSLHNSRQLIISADDFGLTESVSRGILDAFDQKGITDTNFVTTSPYSKVGSELAKKRKYQEFGIHLNLEIGDSLYYQRPMAYFDYSKNKPDYFEMVENEFNEQIAYLINSDLELTHITYHKNIVDCPEMAEIIKRLALQYNVPVRHLNDSKLNMLLMDAGVCVCDDKLINPPDRMYSQELIQKMLRQVTVRSTELVCHLGYESTELSTLSSVVEQREMEWNLFTSNTIKCMIREMGFTLINYKKLKEQSNHNGTGIQV